MIRWYKNLSYSSDLKMLIDLLIGTTAFFLLIGIMCILPLLTLNLAQNYYICQEFAQTTQLEYRWSFWTACRVNVNGYWLYYSDVDFDMLQGDFNLIIEDK